MSTYLDRIVADSADRPAWLAVRSTGLGASDAASFANVESIEKYARAKLKERTFSGNAHTETGRTWERSIVAAAGFEQSTLMFCSAENPLFFATPDGILPGPDGPVLAEAKTLMIPDAKIEAGWSYDEWVPHLTPAHARQVAWAQYVLGAPFSKYLVLPRDERHKPLGMMPKIITIDRDEALIAHLLTIAQPVLAVMQAARRFERTLTHE